MPALENPRHEIFAQNRAIGMTPTLAYEKAGFEATHQQTKAQGAAKLVFTHPEVKERIAELQSLMLRKTLDRNAYDREVVSDILLTIVRRCLQAEPVLDRQGKETGQYTFQAMSAVKAAELLGIDIGMFVKRTESRHGVLDPLEGRTQSEVVAIARAAQARVDEITSRTSHAPSRKDTDEPEVSH